METKTKKEKKEEIMTLLVSKIKEMPDGEEILMKTKEYVEQEFKDQEFPITTSYVEVFAWGFASCYSFFLMSNQDAEKFKETAAMATGSLLCWSDEMRRAFEKKKELLSQQGIKVKAKK